MKMSNTAFFISKLTNGGCFGEVDKCIVEGSYDTGAV